MAKIQQVKDEALAIIDSALAILNKFPDLNQTDINLSANASLNPLPFLMDLFKRTTGYNKLIDIVSKFIAWNIPLIDAGVKSVLIAKLKDIISCSVNPFFTEEILRDGIVFNAAEIDIADVLKYSPFDEKVGKYFYFDNGSFEEEELNSEGELETHLISGSPDDLIKSNDLNALIWYMINVANKRHVWKPKKYRKGPEFREDYPHTEDDTPDAEIQREKYDNPKQELDEAYQGGELTQEEYDEKLEKLQNKWIKYRQNFHKLKKEDGIITLEYHRKPQSVKNAYGGAYTLQTPYQSCLHVFIGDAREKENGDTMRLLKDSEDHKRKSNKDIDLFNKQIDEKQNKIYDLQRELDELYERFQNYEINEKEYDKLYKRTQRKINALYDDINSLKSFRNTAYDAKREAQSFLQQAKDELESVADVYFPFINSDKIRNYYYGKSLIEFNIDYIMSLELFDAKSLAARLLDCLTASLIIDLHLSYKQQLIKNEVKKLVQKVTETDDLVISDCFFTFSNKEYDEMSRKAELRKAGLLTINGDETSAVKIDAESIFEKLNQINENTEKETIQSIISGAITDISKELSSTKYLHTDNTGKWKEFIHGKNENYGVEINFIENILQSLAEVITMTVLSPKVYLLLLINLKIIGRETNFDLKGFLEQYRQLLAEIIRSIRDMILEFITKELMIIIGDLIKEITIKLSIEQALYWQSLMKRLIDCFKLRRNRFNIDFSIDDVDYADILPSEDKPKEEEC